MPSFDIASSVDIQTLDNAVNIVKKEITNRFDFKGIHVVIDLNKKDYMIKLESDSEMKLQQIVCAHNPDKADFRMKRDQLL